MLSGTKFGLTCGAIRSAPCWLSWVLPPGSLLWALSGIIDQLIPNLDRVHESLQPTSQHHLDPPKTDQSGYRRPVISFSDVNDDEWAFAAPYLVLMREDAPQRERELREVFNGSRLLVRAGAPWRMMPNDLPP